MFAREVPGLGAVECELERAAGRIDRDRLYFIEAGGSLAERRDGDVAEDSEEGADPVEVGGDAARAEADEHEAAVAVGVDQRGRYRTGDARRAVVDEEAEGPDRGLEVESRARGARPGVERGSVSTRPKEERLLAADETCRIGLQLRHVLAGENALERHREVRSAAAERKVAGATENRCERRLERRRVGVVRQRAGRLGGSDRRVAVEVERQRVGARDRLNVHRLHLGHGRRVVALRRRRDHDRAGQVEAEAHLEIGRGGDREVSGRAEPDDACDPLQSLREEILDRGEVEAERTGGLDAAAEIEVEVENAVRLVEREHVRDA